MSPRARVAFAVSSLKEHLHIIATSVAIATFAATGVRAAGWGFTNADTKVAALTFRVDTIKTRQDSVRQIQLPRVAALVEALAIDRCLDHKNPPSDFARVKLNCARLLAEAGVAP